MNPHPLYRTWQGMRTRCNNPNADNYPRYGGKGITVCDRWSDFNLFVEDMGERPEGYTLDRIISTGNYEPSNCRWATYAQQAENRSPYVITLKRPNSCTRNNPMRNIETMPSGTYRVHMRLLSGRISKSFNSLQEALEFRSNLEMEREMHKLLGYSNVS